MIWKYIKGIRRLNLKTIYFNFHYFPFSSAIKFPIFVSSRVKLLKTAGTIKIASKLSPGMIRLGFGDVGIFDQQRSRSIWEHAGQIIFQGPANLGHGFKLSVLHSGQLVFGPNFVIVAESVIICHYKINFGADCLISWDVLIMDTDYHQILSDGFRVNPNQEVIIGNHVWVSCRALILKGAVIPDDCVIGAGALVSKSLADQNSVYAGTPARQLRANITWRP